MNREITQSMTVAQIATAHPELIQELERLGIDYCCGGGQRVGDAAIKAGHDPAAVVAQLSEHASEDTNPDESVDYATMSMTQLADHIEETHHAYARKALDRLTKLIGKCVAEHADEDPRLNELQDTFTTLKDDMHDHFVREERVLFPWLRRLERKSEITSGPPWSVKRPIDCMVHDHDDVGEAFQRIHHLTDDLAVPRDACSTWRAYYRLLGELETDTHLHIHKENNILFPAGIEAEKRLGGSPRLPTPSITC